MSTLQTYPEESPTDLATIQRAERLWGKQFPQAYKDFLLKHNGVIVYPNFPTIKTENNDELWAIERFVSIGDVILQKQYDMIYTLKTEHYPEDLAKLQLNKEHLLTFAIGERGCYYLNLSYQDFGQIYFCNYSGGDGLVRVMTNSFTTFVASLDIPDWIKEEEDYDSDFKLNPYYPGRKVFQSIFYQTEEQPELGRRRFEEVLTYFEKFPPEEHQAGSLPRNYVYDMPKLKFLLEKGYPADGLLLRARNFPIIRFLIEAYGQDINEAHEGRYPLQNYLNVSNRDPVKHSYQLIDQLLASDIDLDWSVLDNTDKPLLEALAQLHEAHLQHEQKDKAWWIKNGKPSGHQPFMCSERIEEKLGLRFEV